MTPEQAAHETRDVFVRATARFMADPSTYARGAELGFEGFDFYTAGRGGVLGDVDADIVVAAFVFFAPETIHGAWARSAKVMLRHEAAREWAACLHTWAEANVSDDIDASRVAYLLGCVIDAAPVAGAPLFAGWRALPQPGTPKALALHRMNAIRELRGALHAAAVLTVGLAPVEAVAVLVPTMLPTLGWDVDPPDPEPLRDRWNLAEARTDRMLGRALAVLDEAERKELVDVLSSLST